MVRTNIVEQINDSRRKNYLIRQRLQELLTPSGDRGIFVVEAATGFGKTRAVLDYIAGSGQVVIWLALTEEDNYPLHFWETFVSAVEPVNADAAMFMRKNGFPVSPRKMHIFYDRLQAMMKKNKSYIFVLDDYHVISNKRVEGFVQEFISRKTVRTYLYLVSRYPVTLIEETLCRIGEADLIFRVEEIEDYFHQKGIGISYELIQEIHRKTAGWPFAVYLASLAVQRNKNILNQLNHFSDQLIFETIDQEIFSAYPEDMQKFIVRMSLLKAHPVRLIESLYDVEFTKYYTQLGENIFIRYSQNRENYLTHQLFREFLEMKQDMLSEEERQETCRKAAQWYGTRGATGEEVYYYNKAGDYEKVWSITWDAIPMYYTADSAEVLIDAMESFPEEFVDRHPMIQVAKAALCSPMGELEQMYQLSDDIIKHLKTAEETAGNRRAMGEACMNLAFYYMQTGDVRFTRWFRSAAQYLKRGSQLYRKPHMFLLNGDPVVLKSGEEGELDGWIRALEEAEPYYSALLQGSMDGMAILARAMGYYYRGESSKAEEYAVQAVYKGKENQQADIVCSAYFLMIRLGAFKGDYTLVMDSLEQMKQYADLSETGSQFHMPDVAYGAFYAKIEVCQYIPEWIVHEKNYAMTSYYYGMGMERIIKANSMLTEGNYYELIPYLMQTEEIYVTARKYTYSIHVQILLAIAYYNIQNMDKSCEHLYRGYEMSYKNKIVMIPAVYGKYSRSMLTAFLKLRKTGGKGLEKMNVQRLMDMQEEWLELCFIKSSTFAKRVSLIRTQYLLEHGETASEAIVLTEREKQVLTALSEGFTRDELADSMNISINTVKSTLAGIYSKLGAVNSTHAVSIALTRGLL